MLKIGLTGGIGSGKSVVAEMFKVLGIPVFDADKEAKILMNTNADLIAAIIKEFGSDSYNEGILDRKYLASQVFNDNYKLDKLNAIVHPITIATAETWMNSQTTPYAVKEAALFFESGSAVNIDYMIGVTAPVTIRLQRVMERDKLTREEVKARMSKQIDDEIKMKLCDFVLINDEQHLLIPQVLELHKKFLELSTNK